MAKRSEKRFTTRTKIEFREDRKGVFYVYRSIDGKDRMAAGHSWYLGETEKIDLFSPTAMWAVLGFSAAYARKAVGWGFPRGMYVVPWGEQTMPSYSRTQVDAAYKMWVDTQRKRSDLGYAKQVEAFVRAYAEVFYALDAPSEMHGRILAATRKFHEIDKELNNE